MKLKALQPIIIVALTAHVGLLFVAALLDAWFVALAMLLVAAINVATGFAVGMYAGESRSAAELNRAHRELATARAEIAVQQATNTSLRDARDRAMERAEGASQRAEGHLARLREVEARLAEVAP